MVIAVNRTEDDELKPSLLRFLINAKMQFIATESSVTATNDDSDILTLGAS